MFKWLGSILGTEKALGRTIDAVSSGIDKMVYTDEEKADAAQVKREAVSKAIMDWLQTTQGQNKARRVLALTLTFLWVAMFVFSCVLDVLAVWYVDHADALGESVARIDARTDGMTGAMMLILGFYFAAPHMSKFAEKAMDRFAGGK